MKIERKEVAPQAGLEPATDRLEGGYSIRLNYWGITE